MAYTPLEDDLDIISKLDDEPNDHQGLTPAQLKARFDLAGNKIKKYINDTLLPEMAQAVEGCVPMTRTVNGKALSEDIALTAQDVLAMPAGTFIPTALADLNEDSTHRTVTDAEKAAWNAKGALALGETAETAYRGDRGKIAYEHSQQRGNPHNTRAEDIGAAEAVHTHANLSVNGKALSGDMTLTAADVGAAEAERKINGKPLTADITLTLDDLPEGTAKVAFTAAEKEKLAGLKPYTLPAASAGTLGGVRVGAGLSIDANGVLSATTASGDVPGDMVRAVYDPDGDGVVHAADEAYAVDWGNVRNRPEIPAALADLNEDSMHRTVTDGEKAVWNAKSSLALGETAESAYRGDRGKVAYDHSQQAGNPHGTTPADIGAAAETHVHTNLSINGKVLSRDVAITASDVGAAAMAHTHGNITSDGKIGSASNRAVYTGMNGLLQAGTLPVSAGGTGATTASAARSALGAAALSHTHTASDVSGLAELLGQAVKMEMGSYVGTGTYGVSNPNSLTFEFPPKFVWIYGYVDTEGAGRILAPTASYHTWMHPPLLSTSYSKNAFFGDISKTLNYYGKRSEDGKTIYWYLEDSAIAQFNSGNRVYLYLAFS